MIIEHLDACGRDLLRAGIPCTNWQMWIGEDDGLVHYFFGCARDLTDAEENRFSAILNRYFEPA